MPALAIVGALGSRLEFAQTLACHQCNGHPTVRHLLLRQHQTQQARRVCSVSQGRGVGAVLWLARWARRQSWGLRCPRTRRFRLLRWPIAEGPHPNGPRVVPPTWKPTPAAAATPLCCAAQSNAMQESALANARSCAAGFVGHARGESVACWARALGGRGQSVRCAGEGREDGGTFSVCLGLWSHASL